jgi:hypothetical protein
MDFTDYFDQWYFGEGYPTYSIVYNQTGNDLNMNVTQVASYPSVTSVFKMLMEYKVSFTNKADTFIYLYQDANFSQFTIPINGNVTGIDVDPHNWVVNKVGSISVGVEETQNPVYFTYGPNPARESLNLFMANTTEEVQINIQDMMGRVMMQVHESGATIKLNTSELPKGSYLIRLQDGENTFVRRFVKI